MGTDRSDTSTRRKNAKHSESASLIGGELIRPETELINVQKQPVNGQLTEPSSPVFHEFYRHQHAQHVSFVGAPEVIHG